MRDDKHGFSSVEVTLVDATVAEGIASLGRLSSTDTSYERMVFALTIAQLILRPMPRVIPRDTH